MREELGFLTSTVELVKNDELFLLLPLLTISRLRARTNLALALTVLRHITSSSVRTLRNLQEHNGLNASMRRVCAAIAYPSRIPLSTVEAKKHVVLAMNLINLVACGKSWGQPQSGVYTAR